MVSNNYSKLKKIYKKMAHPYVASFLGLNNRTSESLKIKICYYLKYSYLEIHNCVDRYLKKAILISKLKHKNYYM